MFCTSLPNTTLFLSRQTWHRLFSNVRRVQNFSKGAWNSLMDLFDYYSFRKHTTDFVKIYKSCTLILGVHVCERFIYSRNKEEKRKFRDYFLESNQGPVFAKFGAQSTALVNATINRMRRTSLTITKETLPKHTLGLLGPFLLCTR